MEREVEGVRCREAGPSVAWGANEGTVSLFCNQCGHDNPPRSGYCSSCGAKLEYEVAEQTTASFPAVGSEDAGGVDDISPTEGLLLVLRGPNAGSRFLFDQELVRVGRHPEADILLDDITVSRLHAEIHRGPDGFSVCDVGSLNGTYLNRRRVEKAVLRSGDELQIGRFRLVFYMGEAKAEASA